MMDYLIVGHGVAGACLAFHLDQMGKSISIIDNPSGNISSTKAAGLYNPITGRKMVKTWMADELFPYLRSFYSDLEDKLGADFLIERPIYRPFLDIEEQNDWMGKSASKKFSGFVGEVHTQSAYPQSNDFFGGIQLDQSGFLAIGWFLEASKKYWIARDSYQEEVFDYSEIQLSDNVSYRSETFKRVIFCEGPGVHHNPYFSWLPIQLLKGEVLELNLPERLPVIFNRGVFILEVSEGLYRSGSTYDRHDLTLTPTKAARESIESKLIELINVDYKVVNQYAGLRPTVVDRRPILGLHPKHEQLGIFNGLGTKGVSLAPYFAKQFSEYLENGKEVAAEVFISRFLNKFID